MDTHTVEVITCDSGDWEVLKLNGKVYSEGHDIPVFVWLELLESLGVTSYEINISDKEMESGQY